MEWDYTIGIFAEGSSAKGWERQQGTLAPAAFLRKESQFSAGMLPELAHFRTIPRPSRLSHDLVVHRDSKHNNEQTPFEFTEANMTRLCALIKNYPDGAQRSALGGALDLVQRQIGWVPISAMNKVAEILNMPRMRVYEYATFYTMIKRSFKGKYHVKVCSTTPCMIMGSDIILNCVEQVCECKEGHVSKDGMFGVDIVQCQGACANAPVLVVDDDYYVMKVASRTSSGYLMEEGGRRYELMEFLSTLNESIEIKMGNRKTLLYAMFRTLSLPLRMAEYPRLDHEAEDLPLSLAAD